MNWDQIEGVGKSDPACESPVCESPACDCQACDSPVCDSPVCDSPVCDSPVCDSPACDSPVCDSPACNSEDGSIVQGQSRIGDLWCRVMHAEPMWPTHGRYQCRVCGRRFQVYWERPSTATPGEVVWPPETQPEASQPAGRA
jgi:hypothetical protein